MKLDVIQLALKGYKMEEIKELVQMQKDLDAEETKKDVSRETFETEEETEEVEETEEESEEVEETAENEEIKKLKEQIKELQAKNSREDLSGKESDKKSLEDIFRNYM